MTKKEKLELINEVTLAVMEALSKNGMNTHVKRPVRTKILPDDTATAIGDIIAEAVSEQEKTGKMPVVQKDTAIIMEYSEKQYAIWGDTKTRKEIIKKFAGNTAKWGIIWGYKPKGVTEENKAQGWFIPKSKLDGNGGMKAMLAELKDAGLVVKEGKSIRPITEAYRANKEKVAEEKPEPKKKTGSTKKAKSVPLPTPSYTGKGYTPKGCFQGEFTRFVKNEDLYIHKDAKGKESAYICIGEDAFMLVSNKVNGAEIANYELVCHVAEYGFPCSVNDGTIKKVMQWQLDAFKESDKESYEWLINNVKVA